MTYPKVAKINMEKKWTLGEKNKQHREESRCLWTICALLPMGPVFPVPEKPLSNHWTGQVSPCLSTTSALADTLVRQWQWQGQQAEQQKPFLLTLIHQASIFKELFSLNFSHKSQIRCLHRKVNKNNICFLATDAPSVKLFSESASFECSDTENDRWCWIS